MSSVYVRDQIKTFLDDNSAESIVDMSGEFREIKDLMEANSLGVDSEWIGLQFVGSSQELISVPKGYYREYGSVFLHVVAPVSIGAIDGILTRCETISSLFRGERINDIIIESVSPPNTESGTTIEFDNNFTSASVYLDYYRDRDWETSY